MLRRFHIWLRVVLLSEWLLWTALTSIVIVWLAQQMFIQWFAVFAPELTEKEKLMLSRPAHFFAVVLFAAVYGWYRACMFHPVENRSYGVWLAQTPWRYPHPLPLGPLALVWQDVVVLAILLSSLVLPPHLDSDLSHVPIVVFIVVYCANIAFWNFALQVHWAWIGFVLLTLVGMHVLSNPVVSLTVALAMYLVTKLGMAEGLRDFPYSEQRRAELGLVPFERQSQPDVPWPIAPAQNASGLSTVKFRHAVIAGLLLAVVFCSVSSFFRYEPGFLRGLLLIHAIIATIAVLSRLVIYIGGHWPPISLFGRIATRRLLIPGYDIILVAPLVMVLVAILLPQVLMRLGLVPILAVPLATGATVTLALSLPPQLEKWHYTGHYRIPAVRRIGREFVET